MEDYKKSDLTCKNNPLTYAKFLDDYKYIQNDVITQLPNGNFIRFSTLLKMVSVMDFTKNDYIRFWNTKYIRNNKKTKYHQDIMEVIEAKFKSGLTPLDTMIRLISNSNDNTPDKTKALKLLKGK